MTCCQPWKSKLAILFRPDKALARVKNKSNVCVNVNQTRL